MSNAALELHEVERVYNPRQPSEVHVLRGASLRLEAGEVAALTAPSGAGKSTLLHIAGLLDRPDAGEVTLAGTPAADLSDARRTALRRRAVGFVYQFHHLLQEFTAEDNVALPMLAEGVPRAEALVRARRLLASVGLDDRASHRPSELSGGQQQRVALCRGLANRPAVLLADEPTGNLDPAASARIFDMLIGLARDEGLAALVATHDLELAARMDRVLRIENGRILDSRPPSADPV